MSDVRVRMHKCGRLGHAPLGFFFCSEIASEAFWDSRMQSHSSYSSQNNFGLSIYAHAKPVDIKFPQENSRTADESEEHQAYML